MAKQQFSTAGAFDNRRGIGTETEAPVSGATITKSIRFSLELWTPLELSCASAGWMPRTASA